ncbi:MAG: lipopolysaccharide heptosyltransferase II [Chloracidobacterium sp.]|nr:lipopolysaccharide heptosyltransferase II [Chloracidobacterium sp.]
MKIIVRGTNWIGDAVMSVPALRELRRIFPDARITLHTRSWADGLFQDASFIDELVTYDRSRWAAKDIYRNSQFLRDDGYDLAIMLPNSFESAMTTFLMRVPRRIGYNKDARGLLLTDPIAVPEWKGRRHEVFYYLNLISEVEKRVLGRDTVSRTWPETLIEISDERWNAAQGFLTAAGIDPAKRTVALGVGSTNSRAKRWPAEKYAALSDMLQAELDAKVLLVGDKSDGDVAADVISLAERPPINLTGKTDLAQAVAVLAVVDLLVSNDMGLAHVSAALNTPTITIFGPTNPETTRPWGNNAIVVREPVDCSPCMLRDCPIDHRCMTRITPEAVLAAIEDVFNAHDSVPENHYETPCDIS